jgi:signal transduction histidine kinase
VPQNRPQDPRSSAARREFLARFFHDLATPLSAVSLHLEGADRKARRGADPAESLAIARSELSRAFDLFERGRELLLREPAVEETFSFDDFVAETISEKTEHPVQLEGKTGGRVKGDRRALSEALSSLLVNALESSADSSVSVSRERAEGRLRARVANVGRLPGNDPEALFSPRIASAGKTWGMGLARARVQAAEAGGAVRLEQAGERVVAVLDLPEESN